MLSSDGLLAVVVGTCDVDGFKSGSLFDDAFELKLDDWLLDVGVGSGFELEGDTEVMLNWETEVGDGNGGGKEGKFENRCLNKSFIKAGL